MQDPNALQLPYLLRDMLRFEGSVSFGLRLQLRSYVAGSLTIRGCTREGIFTYKQVIAPSTTMQTFNFRIPDVPIVLSVIDEALNRIQGTTYCSLSLTANDESIYKLCSGYVYDMKGISYPQTFAEDYIKGGGYLSTVVTADPAAGAMWTIPIPDGQMWKIQAVQTTLVTDATVANRRVHIKISTAAGPVIDMFSNVDQTASTTVRYVCANYGSTIDELDGGVMLLNLPKDLYLVPGDSIDITITGGVAGDNLSTGSAIVEKFIAPLP